MKNIGRLGLLCLIVCLCCCVQVESVFCDNGVGYCNDNSWYIECYINSSDTQLIKELLSNCSNRNTNINDVRVFKDYLSNTHGNILIDIELPSNIQSLFIGNFKDNDNIRITTNTENTALTRINVYPRIDLESSDFFSHFIGLQDIHIDYVYSREAPSFNELKSLTYLSLTLLGIETHTLDDRIVSGLSNLKLLSLYSSYFNGITKGAFRNMNQLTYLNIANNKLGFIEDGVFSDCTHLIELRVERNGLNNVSNDTFEGLSELTYLSAYENSGFPIISLLQTRNLEKIDLRYNEYQTLSPFVFQQMKNLTDLYLSDPFVCDCMLQWTSVVSEHGISILGSPVCSQPSKYQQKSIYDPTVYSICSQSQTYQCFNKLITCPDNLVCYNTNNSYICEGGYHLTTSDPSPTNVSPTNNASALIIILVTLFVLALMMSVVIIIPILIYISKEKDKHPRTKGQFQ